ncbi:hypothetical protein Lal_00012451 [Lupinus albus]|nr:hypothetical protein Lal_00012451 [Lupinus albus]
MEKRQRPIEAGGSSSVARGRTVARRDPYYFPNLQTTRLAKFQGRRLTYIRCAAVLWLVEQGLLYILIAYILVPRDDNHDEPTTHDLHLMFSIKERLGVKWPLKILQTMSLTASTSSGSRGTNAKMSCADSAKFLTVWNFNMCTKT